MHPSGPDPVKRRDEVVAEARDADQLLVAVEAHRPDLAVVDIRMPSGGNAGLKAAEQTVTGTRARRESWSYRNIWTRTTPCACWVRA